MNLTPLMGRNNKVLGVYHYECTTNYTEGETHLMCEQSLLNLCNLKNGLYLLACESLHGNMIVYSRKMNSSVNHTEHFLINNWYRTTSKAAFNRT